MCLVGPHERSGLLGPAVDHRDKMTVSLEEGIQYQTAYHPELAVMRRMQDRGIGVHVGTWGPAGNLGDGRDHPAIREPPFTLPPPHSDRESLVWGRPAGASGARSHRAVWAVAPRLRTCSRHEKQASTRQSPERLRGSRSARQRGSLSDCLHGSGAHSDAKRRRRLRPTARCTGWAHLKARSAGSPVVPAWMSTAACSLTTWAWMRGSRGPGARTSMATVCTLG